MTSSNGNAFRVTGPLWGKTTGHLWIPITKTSEWELWFVFFRLNKRLNKQSRCRCFETRSPSLWRRCNGNVWRYMLLLSHNVLIMLSFSRNKCLKFSNTPQYRMCETHLFKEMSPKDTILVWCWNIMRRGLRYISKRHNRHQSVSIRARRYFPLPRIGDALQWRHNGRDSVSNHQPHDCLLNRLFRRRSKDRSLAFVRGIHWEQLARYAENVSIWWRHHGIYCHPPAHCQHLCVSMPGSAWIRQRFFRRYFRKGLVAYSAPSVYMHKCYLIIKWTPHRIWHRNTNIALKSI